MSDKWFCCCGASSNCQIGSDLFTRSLVGSGWFQSAGTWSISSNRLTTSDTNAYARFETAHPDGDAKHFVIVDITFDTCGDKARVVLSDTLYAEIEYCQPGIGYSIQETGCSVLRIYNGSTLLDEREFINIEPTVTLVAAYNSVDQTFSALLLSAGWVGQSEGDGVSPCIRVDSMASYPAGTKVGLGTGDTVTGNIYFDNFYYFRYREAGWLGCPGPCTRTTVDTCTINPGWQAPIKNTLITSDLACDYTINAGTWDGIDSGVDATRTTADYLSTTSANARITCGTPQESPLDGYTRVSGYIWFENQGDTAIVYLDYTSTADSHYAVITSGDTADGTGGSVSLWKNGVVLETRDIKIRTGRAVGFMLKTAPAQYGPCAEYPTTTLDGSGLDVLCFTANTTGSQGNSPMIQSGTTVNANKYFAFGTGATVTGYVRFSRLQYSHNSSDSGTQCPSECCKDCYFCPAGDQAKQFQVTVSGLAAIGSYDGYGGDCCTCTDLNATYLVSMNESCSGIKLIEWCSWIITAAYSIDVTMYAFFQVEVKILKGATGWIIEVSLWTMYTPHPTHPGNRLCRGNFLVRYRKSFPMTTRCDALVDEALTFYEEIELGSPKACSNTNTLTVKVTSIG